MQTIMMGDGTLIHLETINSREIVSGRTQHNFVTVFKASMDGSLLDGYGTTPDEAVADLYRERRDQIMRLMEEGLTP